MRRAARLLGLLLGPTLVLATLSWAASTFTPNLNLEKPGVGDPGPAWAVALNANFDKLDFGVTTPLQRSGTTLTIADASTGAKGVAQFSASWFTVSSGVVSLADSGVSPNTYANATVTVDVKGRVTAASAGGAGGAPGGAQYVTLALDGTLTAERTLAVSSNLTLVDSGANANVTLDLAANPAVTRLTLTGHTLAGLPAAATAGRVTRVTDDIRGLWVDTSTAWVPLSPWVSSLQHGTAQAAISALGANVGVVVLEPRYAGVEPTYSSLPPNVALLDLRGGDWGGNDNVAGAPFLFEATFDSTQPAAIGRGAIVYARGRFGTMTDTARFYGGIGVKIGDATTPIPAGKKGTIDAFEANLDSNQAAADIGANEHMSAYGATVFTRGGARPAILNGVLHIVTTQANADGIVLAMNKTVAGGFQSMAYLTSIGTQSPSEGISLVAGSGGGGGAAFADGLVFSQGATSGAAIVLPNAQPIKWRNAADTAKLIAMNVDGANNLVIGGDVNSGLTAIRPGSGLVLIQSQSGAVDLVQIDPSIADGQTALLVRRDVGGSETVQRVTMGAADSGGVGFKLLRVPN